MSKPSPVDSANTLFSLDDYNNFLRSSYYYCSIVICGVILNWGLFWCLAVQVYIYYISSKNDRLGLKLLVCFLFLAAIAQTGLVTYYARKILVVSWHGRVFEVDFMFSLFQEIISRATVVLPIVNGLISAAVQIFFSWRIWFLNQTTVGRVFAILIGIIAILQFIASLLLNKLLVPVNYWSNSFPSIIVMVVWLAGNFLADVLIALCMLYTLRVAQRQSLSKGAKTIISRLMVNTVQTGAITAVATGAGLAFKLFSPNNFQIITFILGHLVPILTFYRFTNVCLANLNARARVRRLGNDPQFSTVRASERDPGLGRANTTLRFARQSTILAQSEATEP
ncbi:hypothetical protein BD779DRAFT_1556038 [Infundibulicybe gibba]|nr:hypothetical protein BD779DRAFT_1556038 [Infundibulicybe gibba]